MSPAPATNDTDSGGDRYVGWLQTLEDDEVLDALEGLQRAQGRIAWLESQAILRLAGPHLREREVMVYDHRVQTERMVVVVDEVRDEVAAALRRSSNQVHDQIATARLLNGPLADTGRALRDGRITAAHVRVIVEQVRRHPEAVHCTHRDANLDSPAQAERRRDFTRLCTLLQERVLPGACVQTPAQTKAVARRAMVAIDAAGEQRRRAAARSLRDVWVSPEEDGLSTLVARLDSMSAHAIQAAVNAAATTPGVIAAGGETAGERRAEALAALVLGQAEVTMNLEVTVPLAALAGSGDGGGSRDAGAADGRPEAAATAVLPDGTLVDHADVVDVLDQTKARATLRRLVVDTCTGTAIDLGRTRYEVSDALRRWIVARDRTCRFPGCRRRAMSCQIDHIRSWQDGGASDAANLQALCVRHHLLKTHGNWEVTRDDASGITRWVSPLGRVYEVGPESALPPPGPPPPGPPPPALDSAGDPASHPGTHPDCDEPPF